MMKKTVVLILLSVLLMSAVSCRNQSSASSAADSTLSQNTTVQPSAESSAPADRAEQPSVNSQPKQESLHPSSQSAESSQTPESSAPASQPAESSQTSESSAPASQPAESNLASASSVSSSQSVESTSSNELQTTSEVSSMQQSFSETSTSTENSVSDIFLNIHTKVSSVSVSWNLIKNADGYIVECSSSADFPQEYTSERQTTENSLTFEQLQQNTTYFLRIRTYRTKNGERIYSGWSETYTAPLKTIEVIDGATYVDGVLIANKTYALPSYFGYGLTDETYQAYNAMVAAAAADGITLWMESGFRSYETQSFTYQSFVWDRGVALADLCSARPGHSEHQTGLALDFNTTSDAFAYTPEAAWIEAHCAEFGFIIRYPQGKEEITGYKYEPWHVRYLGMEKAAEISASGLTLEEYYGITSIYQD